MDTPTVNNDSSAMQIVLTLIALAIAVGGLMRVFSSDAALLTRIDKVTLTYFAVAAAVLLLRDVKSLAFGDYKVEFERVRQLAAEAKTTAQNAQAAALEPASRSERAEAAAEPGVVEKGSVPDDPWKGQFGGNAVSGRRRLDADVTPLIGVRDLFRVHLCVSSTAPQAEPLRGAVQFFIHPTFGNDRPVVTVSPTGVAELTLIAWGAFTVGVLADDGRTKLELDLAELQSAPADFRSR